MMKFALLGAVALATAGIAVANPTPAEAFGRGTCKGVYLSATNQTGGRVKIIDVDYRITGFGTKSEPIRNQQVPHGQTWGVSRNLERASGRQTVVIVKYRKEKTSGIGNWTRVQRAESAAVTCQDGNAYNVTLR